MLASFGRMGVVVGSKSKFSSLRSVKQATYRKVAAFMTLALSLGSVLETRGVSSSICHTSVRSFEFGRMTSDC